MSPSLFRGPHRVTPSILFGNVTLAPKILRGSHLSYAAPISKCEWTSAMLRGSEMKCLMDFGNVTRLRTEMFAGLRKCYAAPNRNVCWTSEMLRGSDFAAARPGQAMLDKSYVALRSCPKHYFTHVKACSCLFLLAFLHNGLLWHGHIGHAVISVGIFKVFYASVLSLVVARRRLDLLFFFFSLSSHFVGVFGAGNWQHSDCVSFWC